MQDPDQQRNLLIAVVLSMAILLGWQLFYAGPKMKEEQERQRAHGQSTAWVWVTRATCLPASSKRSVSTTIVRLPPGMPVETFVQTGERTVISYLMKPLYDQFMRAFREK